MTYALTGPQVEPEAAHWTFGGHRIRVVDIHSDHLDIPPFEDASALLDYEIQELAHLAGLRPAAGQIAGVFQPILINDNNGVPFPDNKIRTRHPLSRYFSVDLPPITAQFNTHNWTIPCGGAAERPVTDVFAQCQPNNQPLITNGQELARMFEAETPGLMHRHA